MHEFSRVLAVKRAFTFYVNATVAHSELEAGCPLAVWRELPQGPRVAPTVSTSVVYKFSVREYREKKTQ